MQFLCKYSKDFNNMISRRHITILLILIASVCHAGPARPGTRTFSQPDGSTFEARVRGDEFMKIITTANGNAIIKDADGWWCYATYDHEGQKTSSGHRVGKNVPTHILSASGMIPYEMLAMKATQKRMGNGIRKRGNALAGMQAGEETLPDSGIDTEPDIEPETRTRHGLVILAEYSDVKFRHSREEFQNLLTLEGYDVGGATGCAKEYFDSQFHGMFDFEFTVSEVVTLEGVRAYYGKNNFYDDDSHPAEMIVEACTLADEFVDFSIYDDDDDGYVDNVFVFFAGEDEADDPDRNSDCIWSHAWFITSGAGLDELVLDGKIIDQYACTSELMAGGVIAGIGAFCHEFSHTLDLPDFYDTDYESNGGWAPGFWGSTSLMDGGNVNNNCNTPPYFNAIERELIGLSAPVIIDRNGTYTLEPIHKEGRYYRLDTDVENEYYLFECRSNEGWDEYIGGSGMLVYHIDRTLSRAWEYNTVNVKPSHQHADLVEADNRSNRLTDNNYWTLMSNLSGIFFPYNSTNTLTAETTPGLKFWSGTKCEISITNITREGDNITFSVLGFEGSEEPPVPVNLTATAFMDAAIINFESDRPYAGEATVVWNETGQEENIVTVSPYEEGKYSITLEGLEAGNRTYTVSVYFVLDEMTGEKRSTSFMTSRKAPVDWPYIYLGKVEKNQDGTYAPGTRIALRVYNGQEAEEINWNFNDEFIEPGGDGFFTLTESGTLKAYVFWEDGSTDILEKKINVSPATE